MCADSFGCRHSIATFLALLCCVLQKHQFSEYVVVNDASEKNVSLSSGSPKILTKISFDGFNEQAAPRPIAQRSNAPRGSVLPSNGWTKAFSGSTTVYDHGKDLQPMTSSSDLVDD